MEYIYLTILGINSAHLFNQNLDDHKYPIHKINNQWMIKIMINEFIFFHLYYQILNYMILIKDLYYSKNLLFSNSIFRIIF